MGHEPAALARTAFHEAGHAIADLRGGFVPATVTIIASGDTLGASRALDGWESTEEAERFILSLCAGYAAEVMHDPTSAGDALACAEDDYEKARHVLAFLDGAELSTFEARAAAFVAAEWRAIDAVASELLEHGRLDGDEIALIDEGDRTALATYRANRAMHRASESA